MYDSRVKDATGARGASADPVSVPTRICGRRAFLWGSVGWCLALLGWQSGASAQPPAASGRAEWSRLFPSPHPARRVAQSYVASVPEAGESARRLLDSLRERLPAEPNALRAHLSARIRREFASGDVVIVDGWLLARTEADACLLAQGP